MPCISFGCMRSMHEWLDNPLQEIPQKSQDRLKKILEKALSLGINHFETAFNYGSSERQLGELLHYFSRENIILQTKIHPSPDPEVFTNRFHKSLRRLQVKHIDLLAIHSINNHRDLWFSCRRNGCLAAARRLQQEGKVGHVGFSGHGSTEVIMSAVKHDDDGGFDYINLHYYYIFTSHLKVIIEAAMRDMGVYIISPTDKGGMLQFPPPQFVKLCQPLSPMSFNDLFCLSTQGVTSISVGASQPDHFDEHIQSLQLLDNQTDRVLGPIKNRLQTEMFALTGHDRPDDYFDLFPNFMDTPGHINIPYILWLFDIARGWGLNEYARRRYCKLGHDAPWVAGNNGSAAGDYNFDKIANQTGINNENLIQLLLTAHDYLTRQNSY